MTALGTPKKSNIEFLNFSTGRVMPLAQLDLRRTAISLDTNLRLFTKIASESRINALRKMR
jgi:hypothetical protein